MLTVRIGQPNDFSHTQPALTIPDGIERLQFSSVYPGGWDACSVSWHLDVSPHVSAMPLPMEALLFGHVVVLSGTAVAWEGRLIRASIVAGRVVGIEAQGYVGALEDAFFSSRNTTTIAGLALARELVRQSTSIVTMGTGADAADPGGEHAPADFDGMTAKAGLDQLAGEGDGVTEWGYTVYNRRLAFLSRSAPSPVQYVIPADRDVTVMLDASACYGAAAATYANDSDQIERTTIATRVAFRNRFGFSRIALVNGGERSKSSALRTAQTWLTAHMEPMVSATVTYRAREVQRSSGGYAPGWEVHAGEWATMAGFGDIPLVRATYDGVDDQLTLELGRPAPTTPNAGRELRRAMDAMKRNVSPSLLGGPLRRIRTVS